MELNQQNKQAKQNLRHGIKEQTDTDKRELGRGILMERRGRGKLRNMYKVPMDNRVGVDCGDGWGVDSVHGRAMGKRVVQL